MRPCWLITDGVLADAILIFTPPNYTAYQLKEGKGSPKKSTETSNRNTIYSGTSKREQFGTKPSVHYSEVVCFQRLTIFIMLLLPIIVSVTIILFAVHSCIFH